MTRVVIGVIVVVSLGAVVAVLPQRAECQGQWWESCLSGNEPIGLAWVVILGFLRITANERIMPKPLSSDQAIELVGEWLNQPMVRVISPTGNHWDIFQQIIKPLGTAGNLTTDAHLAALAIGRGATLYSTDIDFSRFQFLQWINPLHSEGE